MPKKLKALPKKTRDELEENNRVVWDSTLGLLSGFILAGVLYLIFAW
jgi:hypothetical protein